MPAAQAVASNSGVDVAAVAAARTTALNRTVRQPVGLTHEQFQEFIKNYQAPSKPGANLPTPIEFKRILVDVDKTIPESQRETIYRDIFNQVGIDLTDWNSVGLLQLSYHDQANYKLEPLSQAENSLENPLGACRKILWVGHNLPAIIAELLKDYQVPSDLTG
jgi:hypothetical protein